MAENLIYIHQKKACENSKYENFPVQKPAFDLMKLFQVFIILLMSDFLNFF